VQNIFILRFLECKIYFAVFLRSKFILRFLECKIAVFGVQNLFCGFLRSNLSLRNWSAKFILQMDGGQTGGDIRVYIEFFAARLPTLQI